MYREPSFSPNGDLIAYTAVVGNKSSICVVKSDGKEKKRITHDTSGSNPVWSRDGKYLAFLSFRDECGKMSLCITDFAKERTLVEAEIGKIFANPFGTRNRIAWNPDKKSIVCAAGRRDRTDLLLVGIKKDAEWLTNDKDFKLNPTFSPDGKKLAYESAKTVSEQGFFWPYVNILDLDTGRIYQLTGDRRFSMAPSWRPDSSSIAFMIRKPGPSNSRMWIADENDSSMKQLSEDAQFEGGPIIWHPIENRILYHSVEGGINIWEFDQTSRKKQRLTNNDGRFYTFYSYSPDGTKIVYCS